MSFTILLKSALQILTTKLPVWIVLIVIGLVALLLSRPADPPQTTIEYRTYWKPPIVRKPLPPAHIIQYTPVPRSQLRVDTVFVPVEMTNYQLWQPESVHRRSNSIVVRSFDPESISYRDYEFKPLEAKFKGSIEMYGLYPHRIGLDASIYRGRVGLFGRIEQGQDLYYGAGIKYRLY